MGIFFFNKVCCLIRVMISKVYIIEIVKYGLIVLIVKIVRRFCFNELSWVLIKFFIDVEIVRVLVMVLIIVSVFVNGLSLRMMLGF